MEDLRTSSAGEFSEMMMRAESSSSETTTVASPTIIKGGGNSTLPQLTPEQIRQLQEQLQSLMARSETRPTTTTTPSTSLDSIIPSDPIKPSKGKCCQISVS